MKTKTLYIGSFAILLMIVFSFSAFATSNTEYTEKGYANGNFETGTGIFASGTDGFNPTYTGARSLSVGNFTPLVADLDGDGANEIIALDGGTIRLYHGSTLSIVAGGAYIETFTSPQFDMITYDLFGNGKKEIIFGKAIGLNVIIDILQWNGSAFALNRSLAFNSSLGLTCQAGGCDVEIKCGQANECVAAMTNSFSTETGDRVFYGFFNSTAPTTVDTYHFSAAAGLSCFPKIKAATHKDYDKDDTTEYIFSGIDAATTLTNHEFAWINYVYINSSNNARGEREITIDLGDIAKAGTSDSCDGGIKWVSDSTVISQGLKSMVTNPFVYDISPSSSSLETVVAYMKGRDTIQMKSYNADSSLLATYPSTDIIPSYGDGFLISDIFRTNAFIEGKTGLSNYAVDFCVAGFTAQEATSNACGNNYNGADLASCASLLCGSEIGQNTKNLIGWHSTEFVLPIDGLYNLTTSPDQLNSIVHSGSMDASGADTELRDVIWPYGVSTFSFSNCEDGLTTKPICYIQTIYNITKQNGIVIPVDVEKSGKNDLLVQQQNALWYLNDGFTNTPVADFCTLNTSTSTTCSGYQLSPCFDNGALQINTTVLVTIIPRDVDVFPTDNVRARAILYYGSIYEQDGNWSGYYQQNTPIPFTFITSDLATTATLRLEVNDDVNNGTVKTANVPFSVATIGVVNGDCSGGILTGTASPASNYSLAQLTEIENKPNTADNPIKNALVQVNDLSGGGMGLATLWLIIMAVVAYAIWTGESHATGTDPRGAMGVIAIVEIIMTVLGIWLGFFGIGIIIIFVILGILILAMFLRKVVTGSGG
jgi:hypothetical protein